METHARSVVKAITYRIQGTLITFGVALLLTGKVPVSIGIGLLDSLIKIAVFYLHERMWNRLSFGKKEPPEYQI